MSYQSSVSIISMCLSFPNLDFDSRTAPNELWAQSHDSHSPNPSVSYLSFIICHPSLTSGSDSTHISCVIYMSGNKRRQTAAGMPRQVDSDVITLLSELERCVTFTAA